MSNARKTFGSSTSEVEELVVTTFDLAGVPNRFFEIQLPTSSQTLDYISSMRRDDGHAMLTSTRSLFFSLLRKDEDRFFLQGELSKPNPAITMETVTEIVNWLIDLSGEQEEKKEPTPSLPSSVPTGESSTVGQVRVI